MDREWMAVKHATFFRINSVIFKLLLLDVGNQSLFYYLVPSKVTI